MKSLLRLVIIIGLMLIILHSGIGASEESPILLADRSTSPPNADTSTIRKEVQEVELILSITDRQGHFIPNLTPADIDIRDNDQSPARITYFNSQTDLPLRIALVIDTSDSVLFLFNSEKHAAEAFLKKVVRPASDQALVIAFNERARILQEATSDYRLLSRTIRKLPKGGNTAIYDAVALAARELAQIDDMQPSRRALIVITDGEDNSSHIHLQDAAELAQQSGAVLYLLDVGFSRAQENMPEAMIHLCEMTGGQYLQAGDEDKMYKAFSAVDKDLRSQYAIGYKPANTSPDGSFHRISISVNHKMHVRHRQGYFAK